VKVEYTQKVLTFRHNHKPLIIETPAGLVVILKEGEDKRKVQVFTPPGVRAFIGEERITSESEYVSEQNGKLIPKHAILTPSYDEAGNFIGFKKPEVIPL